MRLAIISHTEHFLRDGEIVGWGPTVSEINHLTKIFSEIYHIAVLRHNVAAPASSEAYASSAIKFVPLKASGGRHWWNKFSVLATAPHNLRIIGEVLDKVDWAQFRAPTGMGVYVLPYLSMSNRPARWVKYAGNWAEPNPPLSYAFQRWWLIKNFQKSFVTVNGRWPEQKPHILSFENPCIDDAELAEAKKTAANKKFSEKLNIALVGSISESKGVGILIKALSMLAFPEHIGLVYFIGDGDIAKYRKSASDLSVETVFTGSMHRSELNEIYKQVHLLCLPSASEGFPKVVAEGAAYGCIPVVSAVSSLTQYIADGVNGILLDPITPEQLAEKIDALLMNRSLAAELSRQATSLADRFTFSHYMVRLQSEILSKKIG